MNIAVKIVVKRLKKWSAFPKPTFPQPVQNAKVKILTRNYPRLLHSEDYLRVRLVHLPAVAARAGDLAELANLLPVVYRPYCFVPPVYKKNPDGFRKPSGFFL
jgi:hypothetical protein